MTQPQHELTETGSIVDIEAIYREHYSRFLRFAVANLGDARAFVCRHHSWARVAEDFEAVYQRC